jgi:hypothetical protein
MQTGGETHALRSHLFLLRIWDEDLGDGQKEWRGRIQHTTTGQIEYFRDWQVVPALLRAMLVQSQVGDQTMPVSTDGSVSEGTS